MPGTKVGAITTSPTTNLGGARRRSRFAQPAEPHGSVVLGAGETVVTYRGHSGAAGDVEDLQGARR